MTKNFKRFSDISTSERILNTVFLITIGLGYLFSLINIYYVNEGRDGKSGLSMDDIVIMYQGSNTESRLEAAINGNMQSKLQYKEDTDTITKWIHNGAEEMGYQIDIAPILNRDCIICHIPKINAALSDLSNYEGVMEVAESGGTPLPSMVLTSQIHLFGIAIILYFIGRIFLLCDINIYVKRVAVVIPFVAILLDVISWFMTKSLPEFAYAVVISGTLMGLSMAAQIILSIYQMWFAKKHQPWVLIAVEDLI